MSALLPSKRTLDEWLKIAPSKPLRPEAVVAQNKTLVDFRSFPKSDIRLYAKLPKRY